MHVLENVSPGSIATALDPALIMRRVGLEPEPWQETELRARRRRSLWNVTRGGGKSTTSCVVALDEILHGRALHGTDPLVLCVAPAEKQSRRLIRLTKAMLRKLPGAPVPVRSTQAEVEFACGAAMLALPSTESIRSVQAVTCLIFEEMSRFMEDPDGSTPAVDACTPMLAECGRVYGISTPAGQRGAFWRLFTEVRKFPEWHRVTVTAEQSRRISRRKLEEERRRMLPNIFASEYLCDFNDSASQVFPTAMVRAALSGEVKPVVAPWRRFAA